MVVSLIISVAAVAAGIILIVWLATRSRPASEPKPSILDQIPPGTRHLTLFRNMGDLTLTDKHQPLMDYGEVVVMRPEQANIKGLEAAIEFVRKTGNNPVCVYGYHFDHNPLFDYALQGIIGGFRQTGTRALVVIFNVDRQEFELFYDSSRDSSFALVQFDRIVNTPSHSAALW